AGDGAEDGAEDGGGGAGDGGPGAEAPWRVDLLLQATDDLSLVVAAGEVWRSGSTLRQATRTLDAPHEVLLAELGRAVRAYPDLAGALQEAAPTGLDTDLAGAHRFLTEVAPALEVAGFGVLLPAWWRRPSSGLGLRLRASTPRQGGEGTGLLTQDGLCAFNWQAAIGDQQLGVAELRRLAKLKAPLVQVRGKWVELRPGEAEKLVRFLTEGRRAGERAMTVPELLRVAAGAEPAVEGIPVVQVDADGLLGSFLRGEAEGALEVRGTPDGFSGELRPYQERGVAWLDLLERTGLGACLADDMGLGKTATVLALVQAGRSPAGQAPKGRAPARPGRQRKKGAGGGAPGPSGPTLVVCPTSVVGNWQREAERFTPDLRVHVHHGTTRPRAEAFAARATEADLVITSYPLADRDRTALGAVEWHRIVLDEAQNVKNPEAKQTKAVRSLRAPHRIALTGTPVENHLGELWSIMEVLNPGLLGSAASFRERFAVPIERYREEEPAEQLRTLTRPFVLRRLKTDRTIITDLPDKVEMKVLCTLTREQATLYQAVVDEMLRRIDETEGIERKGLVLATMLRLKQVCNHPAQYLGDGSALAGRSGKLERTVEILDEVLEGGEKALVFSQYAEMGTLLRQHLQQRLGCRVAFLHGGVPRKERDRMVAELQESDDLPIMVLSLKAGGTGLNLTTANHVVHFDRWWNPAVENQATDRAFRIGQRRDVQVRKLVCAGTLEDRIDQMIEAKRDLADRIVGAGESWLTELSTDDLVEVFRLSAHVMEER
ncbi:MAG: DEAD/DEAH box helicase, partial [Acidimicrobiales bacterium]